ncbi:WXG100 family type VII secretion target [Amycolatopsis sp. WQ 127309]|uniref:WXG100 family type VII secretion target n=1 Tax=Amycolatopsis sp. WQ 127309 TaxID=2932773 RepID=UPI001FF59C82|nr:hypothetical protein [Amycolatopsis sp. WQ 127309]UOZ06914.1 hypothetical protein MUY22_01065 [Amycolatopsis sp. WQ 127309]
MTEPAPAIDDPALAGLTFDQLAQLVEEVSPDVFHDRAPAFDTALSRMLDVQAGLQRESRRLGELWEGEIADAFDEVSGKLNGSIEQTLQSMESPGYGALLHRAGDALAAAQQRFRDLRAQPDHDQDNQPALQVIRDLMTAYQELGGSMPSLPESVRALPGAAAGASVGTAGPVSTAADQSTTPGMPAGHPMRTGAGFAASSTQSTVDTGGPGSPDGVLGGRGSTAAAFGGGPGAAGTPNGALFRGVPAVLGRGTARAAPQAVPSALDATAAGGEEGFAGFGMLGRPAKDRKRTRDSRSLVGTQAAEAAAPEAAGSASTVSQGFETVSVSQPATVAEPAPAVAAVPTTATADAVATTATTGAATTSGAATSAAGAPATVATAALPVIGGGAAGAAFVSVPAAAASSSPSVTAAVPLSSTAPATGGTAHTAVPPVSPLDTTSRPAPASAPAGGQQPAGGPAGSGAAPPAGLGGAGMGGMGGMNQPTPGPRQPDTPFGPGRDVWDSGQGSAVVGRRPRTEDVLPAERADPGFDDEVPAWAALARSDERRKES